MRCERHSAHAPGSLFDLSRAGARSSSSARFHLTIIAQSWSFALRFMRMHSALVPVPSYAHAVFVFELDRERAEQELLE
jgi:hypothetical protein